MDESMLHHRVQTLLLAAATAGFVWQLMEQESFRQSVEVRRLRMTEPLITTVEHGYGSTQVYTPRIKGETDRAWIERHLAAVMDLVKVLPSVSNISKEPTHGNPGNLGR